MPEPASVRKLKAPREHGAAFIEPPLAEFSAQIVSRSGRPPAPAIEWAGAANWVAWQREARAELGEQLQRYAEARSAAPPPFDPVRPIVMAGHQPELFHAGVWFKVFVLDAVARRAGGSAVNLIIDNDDCRQTAIAVPTGSAAAPRVEHVAFDAGGPALPHEDRPILDREMLGSFAPRVQEAAGPLLPEMLIEDLWPRVIAAAETTDNLGQALATGRHALEREWGLATAELPLSWALETTAFRRFVVEVLARAGEFRETHNRALADYRRAWRVRSRSRPVPNLAAEGGWVETPFWLWTASDPTRRKAWLGASRAAAVLSDGADIEISLPAPIVEHAEESLAALAAASDHGIRLRTRALTTTAFVRLVLCDGFVHGIGGAAYDHVTDAILQGFFRVEPPAYATATATFLLPLERPSGADQNRRATARTLRELRFNPQRHLPLRAHNEAECARIAALADEKRHWIENAAPGRGVERHRAIERINRELAALAAPLRRRLERDLTYHKEVEKAARLLASREYSFCLFPERILRPALLELCRSRA